MGMHKEEEEAETERVEKQEVEEEELNRQVSGTKSSLSFYLSSCLFIQPLADKTGESN